jgi:hypothetical protein
VKALDGELVVLGAIDSLSGQSAWNAQQDGERREKTV